MCRSVNMWLFYLLQVYTASATLPAKLNELIPFPGATSVVYKHNVQSIFHNGKTIWAVLRHMSKLITAVLSGSVYSLRLAAQCSTLHLAFKRLMKESSGRQWGSLVQLKKLIKATTSVPKNPKQNLKAIEEFLSEVLTE